MSAALRYRVANNQAQLTLGGSVLIVDPAGPLVEYADYARLKAEVENSNRINTELLLLSNQQASEVRRLKDTIEEQDAQIVALKRDLLEKSAEMRRLHQKRVHDLNAIGGEQEEVARLKAEVERLRTAGDNMVHLWSSGKGTDLENFTEALWIWTTAKQTKPTE